MAQEKVKGLQRLVSELREANEQLQRDRARGDALAKAAEASAAQERAALQSRLDAAQSTGEGRSRELGVEVERVAAERSTAREQLAATQAERDGLEARAARAEAELATVAAERREAQGMLAEARAAAHASAEEAKRNAAQLTPLIEQNAALGGLRARAEQAEAEAEGLRPLAPPLREERDEALRKLAAVTAEKGAVDELARQAVAQMRALQKERGEALGRASTAEGRAAELSQRLAALLHEQGAARQQLAAVQAERRRLEEALQQTGERMRDQQGDARAKLEVAEARCAEVAHQCNTLAEERGRAREQLAAAQAERGGLEERAKRAEAALACAATERREAQQEAAAARAEGHAGLAELHSLRAQLAPLIEANGTLGGLRARAEQAEAEAAALRPQLVELRAERDEARRRLDEAAAEVRAAEAAAERAAATRQRAEAEVRAAVERAEERQARAEAAERRSAASEEEKGLLHSQLDAMRAERRSAEQREVWARDRASVLEQQRRVLLCLSDPRGKLAPPSPSPLDTPLLDRMRPLMGGDVDGASGRHSSGLDVAQLAGLLGGSLGGGMGMETPPSTPATGRGSL